MREREREREHMRIEDEQPVLLIKTHHKYCIAPERIVEEQRHIVEPAPKLDHAVKDRVQTNNHRPKIRLVKVKKYQR